ncbi:hypothetical protein H696_00023 [Fonticula alba]|uniref:EGF-like domain-containing protein n=1 Tax=Fonticula alba TaxID=691883 RepID=A0A058ZER3_FONAL|nr:hypothetical protein H696_00023 [Fonticula alba]KCV72436.1 hypothetical protein H696_00023 [Fonticula alba]|eukprot:XP_009492137.1 hypothetical protein H696_00023 [Fonticula alba]
MPLTRRHRRHHLLLAALCGLLLLFGVLPAGRPASANSLPHGPLDTDDLYPGNRGDFDFCPPSGVSPMELLPEDTCVRCHPNCLDCDTSFPQYCTACAAGLVLRTDGTCQRNCHSREYLGFSMLGDAICQACPAGCLHCVNAFSCTACDQAHVLDEGQCVSQCSAWGPEQPNGAPAPVDGMCHKCADMLQCVRCSGEGSHDCTECATGFRLQAGRCVAECAAGWRPTPGGQCNRVDDLCLQPAEEYGVCVTCQPGSYRSPSSGSCHRCATGCASCTDANACFACEPGFRLSGLLAVLALDSAVPLAGEDSAASQPGSASEAPTPRRAFARCVVHCPAGEYPHPTSGGACLRCAPGCASCAGPDTCEACATGWVLVRDSGTSTGRCEPCSAGHTCAECLVPGGTCFACTPGRDLLAHQGACVRACPAGFYPRPVSSGLPWNGLDMPGLPSGPAKNHPLGDCLPCWPGCQSCSGPDATQCTACADGWVFAPKYNVCLPDLCGAKTYLPPFPAPPWSHAADTADTADTTVRVKMVLGTGPGCPCQAGSPCAKCDPACEACQDTCVECDATCAMCSGPGPGACTACPGGMVLRADGTCAEHCGPEGVAHASGRCLDCGPGCLACRASGCLACGQGWLLHAGHCVPQCPDRYFPVLAESLNGSPAEGIPVGDLCLPLPDGCLELLPNSRLLCARCMAHLTLDAKFRSCQEAACPAGQYLRPGAASASASASSLPRLDSDSASDGPGECAPCPGGCDECHFAAPSPGQGPAPAAPLALPAARLAGQSDGAVVCTRCSRDMPFLNPDTGACLTACPVGMYIGSKDAECRHCPADCASCTTAHRCTSCKDRLFLLDGACLPEKPSTSFSTSAGQLEWCPDRNCSQCYNRSGACMSCSKGYHLHLATGKCLAHRCPPETVAMGGMCIDCPAGCERCSYVASPTSRLGETVCQMCLAGFFLHRGQCVRQCPATGVIVWPGAGPGGAAPAPASQTVAGACLDCSANCLACDCPAAAEEEEEEEDPRQAGSSGPAAAAGCCRQCARGFVLFQGRCHLEACPPGFFLASATDRCEPCPEGCLECEQCGPAAGGLGDGTPDGSPADGLPPPACCSVCQPGRVLFERHCHMDACPEGYFLLEGATREGRPGFAAPARSPGLGPSRASHSARGTGSGSTGAPPAGPLQCDACFPSCLECVSAAKRDCLRWEGSPRTGFSTPVKVGIAIGVVAAVALIVVLALISIRMAATRQGPGQPPKPQDQLELDLFVRLDCGPVSVGPFLPARGHAGF